MTTTLKCLRLGVRDAATLQMGEAMRSHSVAAPHWSVRAAVHSSNVLMMR